MNKSMKFVYFFIAALFLSSTAHASMQKLSEVSWWAAYGGIDSDGVFACAMVTTQTNGEYGKFVIEYRDGIDRLYLRFVKPTWTIKKGTNKDVLLKFGHLITWNLNAIGSGNELRASIAIQEAPNFLSGFQSSGSIDVTFLGGTEPTWHLATGGGGFVEKDFRNCIKMTVQTKQKTPTQP